eukprot:CAMPEP_0201551032 /NCGR_PEP_ID=MMETSP0173_2-20130828/7277_1 /ASSEMBLY_ACC=CAM_ASM_000268 /TAXON_ID=218659 /ORGANISM="Vexillifera sp., Strain DIVA3 564/2" /LENGTH=350 /DNA_ID=CAMNT_0047961179 /DNA_START=44 /DNA_END=1093 /DNA_ORIENTATION=+
MIEAGQLPDGFTKEDEPMLRAFLEKDRIDNILEEIHALSTLGDHPHIVKFFATRYRRRKLYLVLGKEQGNVSALLRISTDAVTSAAAAAASSNNQQQQTTKGAKVQQDLVRRISTRKRSKLAGLVSQSPSNSSPCVAANRKSTISDEQKIEWILQLASAIKHMHHHRPYPFIHRDIKPENILYSRDQKKVVLCDFGFAHEIRSTREQITLGSQNRGSGFYMPPECYWGKCVNEATDIYSFAMTIWEILSEQKIFEYQLSTQKVSSKKDIQSKIFYLPDDHTKPIDETLFVRPRLGVLFAFPEKIKSLLTAMWHPCYQLRPNIDQVIQQLMVIKEQLIGSSNSTSSSSSSS